MSGNTSSNRFAAAAPVDTPFARCEYYTITYGHVVRIERPRRPTIAWYWLDSTEVTRWNSACQSIETRSSMDGGELVNGSTRARQWLDGRASMD